MYMYIYIYTYMYMYLYIWQTQCRKQLPCEDGLYQLFMVAISGTTCGISQKTSIMSGAFPHL